MKGAKYIVFDNGDFERPVIFPCTLEHQVVGILLNGLGTIISAGFTDGKSCYGKSVSLNTKSRGEVDFKLIEAMNNFEL